MKKIFTLFAVMFALTSYLAAADIFVTNTDDDTDMAPDGSLRAAISAANSDDVIRINIPGGTNIVMMGGIGISGAGKTLTIDGMNLATGKPIILNKDESASGSRLFNVGNSAGNEGLNVTFKNIVFEDIYTTQNGAVMSSGNSSYSAAGAITINLESCMFKNCTADLSATATSGGGGVYFLSHGTALNIYDCFFTGNFQKFQDDVTDPEKKSIGGGVIGSTGTNTAKLTVVNSTFTNNRSLARGGAIFIGHPATIINSTFAGNVAARCGGLYFHNNSQGDFINSVFTHNYSTTTANEAKSDFDKNNATAPVTMAYCLVGATNFTELGVGSSLYNVGMLLFTDYTTNDLSYNVPVATDNGGLYPTIALAENGVATKKGTSAYTGFTIPTADQRGASRLSPPCIGAFEYGGVVNSITDAESAGVRIKAVNGGIEILTEVPGKVSVYNLSGTEVSNVQIINEISISNLSKGVYVVKFVDTTGVTVVSKVLLD